MFSVHIVVVYLGSATVTFITVFIAAIHGHLTNFTPSTKLKKKKKNIKGNKKTYLYPT